MRIEDVLLNFNNNLYEFYEWQKNDKIIHIKSIMICKVNDKIINDFISKSIKVDKKFLDMIKNQAEVYTYTSSYTIKYAVILYNDKLAVAFKFDDNGICVSKSKLIYDEEDDVISSIQDEIEINYEVLGILPNNTKTTRKEKILIMNLCNYLEDLYKNKKYDAIKYYCLECFDKDVGEEEAYQKLKLHILNCDLNVIFTLKKLVKSIKN